MPYCGCSYVQGRREYAREPEKLLFRTWRPPNYFARSLLDRTVWQLGVRAQINLRDPSLTRAISERLQMSHTPDKALYKMSCLFHFNLPLNLDLRISFFFPFFRHTILKVCEFRFWQFPNCAYHVFPRIVTKIQTYLKLICIDFISSINETRNKNWF